MFAWLPVFWRLLGGGTKPTFLLLNSDFMPVLWGLNLLLVSSVHRLGLLVR